MSPLPKQFTDRWGDGYGAADPGHGMLYWHVLLGGNPQLRRTVSLAQERLADFSGLHMTPLQWLHLTVLIAGPADQVPESARNEMLAIAKAHLSGTGSVMVELNRILYHPEAIVLAADPADALRPIREAAQKATQAVIGHGGTAARPSPHWTPHVTMCYSADTQPAGPIIAALGKRLPGCQVLIDTLSLVIQYGSEWLWDWSPVGTISLPGPLLACLPGNTGTSCAPSVVTGRLGCAP